MGPQGVALRRLGPGDVVGEMSLVTGQPRSADVVAVTAMVLWVLDEADFRALTAGSAPLSQALTRTLAGRMAENEARLDRLLGRPGPATDGPGWRAAPGAAGGAGGARGAGGRETEEPSPLSPREREVAGLIAQGLTNREIAAGLVVTERTAATHIEHILNKLGLRNRAQVTAWAVARGLLDGPTAPAAPAAPAARGPRPRRAPPPRGPRPLGREAHWAAPRWERGYDEPGPAGVSLRPPGAGPQEPDWPTPCGRCPSSATSPPPS